MFVEVRNNKTQQNQTLKDKARKLSILPTELDIFDIGNTIYHTTTLVSNVI